MFLDGGGEGKFEPRTLGNNSYRLTEAPRRYIVEGFVLEFRREPRARQLVVDISTERARRVRFTRVSDQRR